MIAKSVAHLAFLGPKGTYSHIAAIQYANYQNFDKIVEHSCQKFNDIFSLVEWNYAEYGIVPIENSNSGIIHEVCHLLLNTQLLLIDEITIPIQHRILMKKFSNIDNIQTIYSHPQPIQQCSKFLKNFSTWKIIRCESSAIAMKTVATLNQTNTAALGSIAGGYFYGLNALSTYKVVSNDQKNVTRFFILKKTNITIINHSAAFKTTLIASFDQKSKKLYEILKILQFYNIKIHYLKPRLLLHDTPNNIIIIIEIMAHMHNIYIQQILAELQKISHTLKILGCYPITSNANI